MWSCWPPAGKAWRIDGEQLIALPPLAAGEPGDDIDDLMRTDAVSLFVERARRVKADFALTESNAQAVVEICQRLDGVPLAIELAAARVIALSPADLLQRLDRRFELLAGGRRGAVGATQRYGQPSTGPTSC